MSSPTELPLLPAACTLDAQGGPARLIRWQRLVRSAHATVTRRGPELEVRFDSGADVAAELSALAAAERECCDFLQWSVETNQRANVLVVTAAAGSPDDIETVAGLFGVT